MTSSDTHMALGIPQNAELLAAIGAVAISHGHLDYTLKMLIKTLADVSIQEARYALAYENSSILRDRAKKLARQVLGEGKALLKVQAFLGRCKHVTEKRNDLIHRLYLEDWLGGAFVGGDDGSVKPLPTIEEVRALLDEIRQMHVEFNHDRLAGWLEEALSEKRRIPRP